MQVKQFLVLSVEVMFIVYFQVIRYAAALCFYECLLPQYRTIIVMSAGAISCRHRRIAFGMHSTH